MDSKLSTERGVQVPLISMCDLASLVMSRHLRYFISELLLITNLSKSVKNFGPTVYPPGHHWQNLRLFLRYSPRPTHKKLDFSPEKRNVIAQDTPSYTLSSTHRPG